nr:biotin/lipoyl-binding protein [candidate division Zixibacteria bacterium]NIT60620.1 biotin/lipoyl-binding protein [Fodinibius sp.]NIW48253.1 biotin/lipoyl-binding protein [Gammaproteobacteria bacterium]NIS48293.1 biotin/lipoyl-binding protein [candidate division Zixibacteria bacterium]NIV08532.1 biotin/lipoyl-binding protein [candidate division Zixibacteria bacterium]
MLKRTNLSLLFILVFVIITGCSQITNQDDALEASGTIQAERVTITSQLSGKVVEIFAEQGQPVKLGDPLFRLDNSFYKSQREQAVAAYNSALSNVDLAQITVSEAELALSTSEAELNAAQADVDLAHDSLSASELQKEIAEINLEMIQLQHEETERQVHQAEQQSRATAWSNVS